MFKKTFVLTLIDGAGKIVGFLLTPIFLKLMSKEDFGENNFMIAIVSSLPVFLTLGFHTTQIKEFITETEISEKRYIFSTTLITSLLVSSLLFCLISIIGMKDYILIDFFKISQNKDLKWFLFACYTITSSSSLILYSFALSSTNSKSIFFYSITKMILLNGFSIFFVITNFDNDKSLSKLVGIVAGDVIFNICFFFIFCRSYWVWNFSSKFFVKALKHGAPLLPAAIATIISNSSDRYFIVKHYNKALIAEYSLALLFLTPINILMVSSQTTLTPIIYSIKDNKDAFKYSVNFFFRYLIMVCGLFIIIQLAIFISKKYNLIPIDYIYVNYLSTLLFFQTITFVSLQIPFNIFIKNNKTSIIAAISITISIFMVLSGLFITPIYGFSGLILSNACICLFFLFFSFYIAKKISQF